eukprot:GHVP01055999.1.p1 GENE.GHVP01055999.1~~GHVP01055999.1.p1  ORF type:complete len:397 (-),score=93.47 GHVP01055999.1:3766-4956(-)
MTDKKCPPAPRKRKRVNFIMPKEVPIFSLTERGKVKISDFPEAVLLEDIKSPTRVFDNVSDFDTMAKDKETPERSLIFSSVETMEKDESMNSRRDSFVNDAYIMERSSEWNSPIPQLLSEDYFSVLESSPLSKNTSEILDFKDADSDLFLSKYRKVKLIGEGDFSEVYLVENRENKALSVVKRLKREHTGKRNREETIKEVKNLWKIVGTRNCIQIYSAWEQNGYCYIETEYLSKGNLRELMELNKCENIRFNEEEIVLVSMSIGNALKGIHSLDIIHMDIKPDNILISDEGVKLCDFGLSRDTEDPDDFIEGDRRYMAPEIFSVGPSKESDIFSLGIVLLEMLTMETPTGNGEYWKNIRRGNLYISSTIERTYSSDCIKMIESMLQIDPSMRALL